MKKLICILSLILLPALLKGQNKIEILLVGTQHQFADSLMQRQDFKSIQENLVKFSPDIICIESIPWWDAASLKEVRAKELVLAKEFVKEQQIDLFDLETRIMDMAEKLKASPEDLLLRSNLANAFYAKNDFWNAYYHYFQLSKALDTTSKVDLTDLKKSFALDSIHRTITKRHTSGEYNNIVYPVAQQVGLLKFENIDYRAGEGAFLRLVKKAAIGTIFNLKVFRLRKLMKKMQKDMLEAERAGELMAHINSREQQDTYLSLIDNSSQFIKSKNMRKAVMLWEFRNEVMANRIENAIIKSKAEKVMVTFGAFHVPFVKRYLEKNPRYKIITYDQYMSSLSQSKN